MYYIGIDVGGTAIKGGIVDENGVVIIKDSVTTDAGQSSDDNVRDIAALVKKLLTASGTDENEIVALGMGVPGTVDPDDYKIFYTCNILFRDYDFVKEFGKYYSFPVCIGNDADCAVIGEAVFGKMKGVKNAVIVTLGTGVGTGTLVNGTLVSGFRGAGGEGGHTVIRMGGEKCGCGRRGCWEAYASATALIRDTKRAIEKHPESLLREFAGKEGKVSGRTAFDAYEAGDAAAKRLISRYVRYVGEGLVNIGNYIRPEIIFIGGGISNAGDFFIRKLQSYVTRYSYGGRRNPYIKVMKATLGNDAGIIGAAALPVLKGAGRKIR